MSIIYENWFVLVALIAVVTVACVYTKKWLKQPTEMQVANIKEWLLYAVTEAETALGSNTGQLKLHMVYDMAVERFSWLSIVPFSRFSEWVDEALDEMRTMLSNNKSIKNIVIGEEEVQ